MKIVRCASISILVLVSVAPKIGASESLEDIAKSLREWRSSFVSVRVVAEQRCPFAVRRDHPALADASDEKIAKYYWQTDWTWTDWGALKIERRTFLDGILTYRTLTATDGKEWFHADFADGDAERLKSIRILKARQSNPQISENFPPLHHLWDAGRGRWLDRSLLENYAAGQWNLTNPNSSNDPNIVTVDSRFEVLELDRTHNLIPRSSFPKVDPEYGKRGRIYYVDEYQEVKPGIYFPKYCRMRQPHEGEECNSFWDLKSVVLNETYPRSYFAPPPMSPGTLVAREVPKIPNPKSETPAPPQNPISATPPSSGSMIQIGLFLAAGITLAMGFWFSRRR